MQHRSTQAENILIYNMFSCQVPNEITRRRRAAAKVIYSQSAHNGFHKDCTYSLWQTEVASLSEAILEQEPATAIYWQSV